MSIISAGTSNTTSIIYTGDTTGNLAFQTNGTTEAMRIDTSQNVGIGTTNPIAKLDVGSSASGGLVGAFRSTATNGGYVYFQGSGSTPTATGYIGAASKLNSGGTVTDFGMTARTNLVFGTNDGTERMRIDSSGRVTMPYQPFFAGSHSNEYATTFTSGSIIPVNSAITNIGNHFNTSTYTFTCPVNGVYEALMSDLSQSASTAALAIYINGNVVARSYWEATRQKGNFCMFYASANDAVTFRVGEGSCNLYGAGGYGRYQIRLLG